ncbi:MAG TPA: TolC family protein, partial [Vicinamibacterales bacterium]
QRNVQISPPSSVFFGNESTRTDTWTGGAGVTQQLPWGGGSYSAMWNSVRTNANFTLNNFNPSVASTLQGSVSQPLLRGFKIDQFRANVATATENESIDDINLREVSETTAANAERAYWTLVLARASVVVSQQSLDLSLELERNNQARVNVGQSPPLDLVSAEAEVAARRTDLIVAQSLVKQAEDALRVLVIDPKRPDYWFVQIQPSDLVPPVSSTPDVDAAVRAALQQRTDLLRARRQIDINDTALALAKNNVLPNLTAQANYMTNGLGGTELLTTGTFPITVVGQEPVAFGDVLRQLFAANYPTWTVGFTLNYPLGRSNEQATLARAQIEREQSLSQVRSTELKAVHEVRVAAMQLDQARQQIDTTHLARQLEEQTLDAEQKRFEVGMSTNYNIIQAQRDLAVSRNNELRAQLDYQLALIAFESAQQIPGAVSTAITIPTPSTATSTTSTPSASTTSGGGGGQ